MHLSVGRPLQLLRDTRYALPDSGGSGIESSMLCARRSHTTNGPTHSRSLLMKHLPFAVPAGPLLHAYAVREPQLLQNLLKLSRETSRAVSFHRH